MIYFECACVLLCVNVDRLKFKLFKKKKNCLNERLTDHTRLGTRPAHEFSELTISENRVRSNICSYNTHNVAG